MFIWTANEQTSRSAKTYKRTVDSINHVLDVERVSDARENIDRLIQWNRRWGDSLANRRDRIRFIGRRARKKHEAESTEMIFSSNHHLAAISDRFPALNLAENRISFASADRLFHEAFEIDSSSSCHPLSFARTRQTCLGLPNFWLSSEVHLSYHNQRCRRRLSFRRKTIVDSSTMTCTHNRVNILFEMR